MKQVRWFLGIAGAILVGAIGSGVWDVFLRGASFWLFEGAYSAATLGINSFRDGVYADAARGYREAASISLLGFVPALFFSFFSMLLLRRRLERFLRRGLPPHPIDGSPDGEHEEFHRKFDAHISRLHRQTIILGLVGLAMTAAMLTQISRMAYTNAVISRFVRCLTVAAPVLDAAEEELFRARFANMDGRAAYVAIMNDLKVRASAGKVSLPEGDPW